VGSAQQDNDLTAPEIERRLIRTVIRPSRKPEPDDFHRARLTHRLKPRQFTEPRKSSIRRDRQQGANLALASLIRIGDTSNRSTDVSTSMLLVPVYESA
jgi:hypothetical protein